MQRIFRLTAIVFVTVATRPIPVQAQFYGVAPWGWYGGGGSTVQGDIARGLGEFVVGAGVYNELSARAAAIDADTSIRLNQYIFRAQVNANRTYLARHKSRRDQIVQQREKTYQRLRDRPTAHDIASGDALNVALDRLNNAGISVHTLKGAIARLDGSLVRDIPFQYAPQAITFSVNQLTQDGPPPALKGQGFASEQAAFARIAEELRKGSGERKEPRPETIAEGLELIKATWDKVEDSLPAGSADRRDAEAYLKGLSGLFRMLGTSASEVLLAGADGRPETKVRDLLGFMSLHDLRFGVARTPRQRLVYEQLHPILASLCDEVRPADAGRIASAATPGSRPRVNRNAKPEAFKKQVVFNVH